MTTVESFPAAADFRRTGVWRISVLLVLGGAMLAMAAIALTVGSSDLSIRNVLDALFQFDGTRDHVVVTAVRLPRVLAALVVGSALGVAGAIMQAVTRNPLASPDLLGINAGAAFAIVIAIVLWGTEASFFYIWFAFAGAAIAACAVQALGSIGPGGATPLKLALAGAILTSFLTALTTAILIFDQATLDAVRLWSIGSLADRSMAAVAAVAPYALIGLAAALVIARQITVLSLGRDVARSVGQNAARWRWVSGIVVVLLAGSAVALAGPIGFVGLVIPHIARLVIGADYRWILPFSALAGAVLLVTADGFLRGLLPGKDIPVGVTMALIGAPVFIYLVRTRTGMR
ncbi:siderophore ABC transporter permease [Terrihabitans soli]|uniref:Siderophore ABC transporter permease n=1 Tax=Terrihabitans soli TaxID=708113 RepID=A0A6S6QRJ6_9HYPH|nr:iron ABC transporter permease [Terrihabitans soli]BCJ90577.1 siderophore ABC transporter permease [Terrihabitans soli]